jgi:hypothetical protein
LSFSDGSINEEKLDGSHLAITCQVACEKPIPTYALIDNGATGYAFMDKDFACHHHLPQLPLKKPRRLEVIDGRPVSSGKITHYIKTTLKINDHLEEAFFYVTKLGHYPIVLGIPWLCQHDVSIRFLTNTVTFDSPYCLSSCSLGNQPVSIQGRDFLPEQPPPPPSADCATRGVGFPGVAAKQESGSIFSNSRGIGGGCQRKETTRGRSPAGTKALP